MRGFLIAFALPGCIMCPLPSDSTLVYLPHLVAYLKVLESGHGGATRLLLPLLSCAQSRTEGIVCVQSLTQDSCC